MKLKEQEVDMKNNFIDTLFEDFISLQDNALMISSIPQLVSTVENYGWDKEQLKKIAPIDFKDTSVAFFTETDQVIGLDPIFVEQELNVAPSTTPAGNIVIDFSDVLSALDNFYDEYQPTFEYRGK